MNLNKSIFGMLHMAGGDHAVTRAMEEYQILQDAGVSGVIVENYHGSTGTVVDFLIKLLQTDNLTMKIGINILPNDWRRCYDIYSAIKDQLFYKNLDFMQLDVIAGMYSNGAALTDEELPTFTYNRSQNPELFVMGGVLPKYYTPNPYFDWDIAFRDAQDRCDAVVVTGEGTGVETPLDKIKSFREKLGSFPLIVGAGTTSENILEQLEYADAAIVGSAFKPNGKTIEPICPQLVNTFMKKLH
jgi:predicted TIM-barrel enzyme